MCVPWESNLQPFALLTQCSTTEPQEHFVCWQHFFIEEVQQEGTADSPYPRIWHLFVLQHLQS